MSTVVISGALANKPHQGGSAWVRLSWLRGFADLGFQVHFVEEIRSQDCVDQNGRKTNADSSVNIAYFKHVMESAGISDAATLICDGVRRVHGMGLRDLCDLASEADLFVNISGHLRLPSLRQRFRKSVYVDLDPGFTQFWEVAGIAGAHLEGHDWYFTVGENLGTEPCSIPDAGISWHATRNPVVMADWPAAASGQGNRFTTVGSWRGPYGPIVVDGRTFGPKAHEFRKYVALPEHTSVAFEAALAMHPADDSDRRLLHDHGWCVIDPSVVASCPLDFQTYVQQSGAEFSVAQCVYSQTWSGWFSDRTVRYLASGKPALVQDTGFTRNIPTGEGLFAFTTFDEAVAGVSSIASDYARHSDAARQIAADFFDSRQVLGKILETVGVAP